MTKTLINLEYPFLSDYRAGYLNINKEPRRVVVLIKKDGTRTSISYARYLMSCHLNRYLDKTEHVDHIDDDKLNDVIENLQILSVKDNNRKKNNSLQIKLEEPITLICPICNESFSRPARNIKHKLKAGKSVCCSRRCGGKNSHKKIRTCIASHS
jgi:hypothetical protein